MSDFELSKSLSPFESVDENRSECMVMRKEDGNSKDVKVGKGMAGDSMAPPTKQARPEYLWENFPNEFGDQWQSLGSDNHLPHSSPEKTSDKYLSEQGSKQLRSSSDLVYRSFKAGSSGFRSHEDYKKAVENHSKWWNKMNAKKDIWLSRERIVNSADHVANLHPSSIKIQECYSSTDSSSSDENEFDKYSNLRRESEKKFDPKLPSNSESSPTFFAQWHDETTTMAKKLGILNRSPEDYSSSKVKKGSSSYRNGHRMELPVEAISRQTLGQTKISSEEDQQKKQRRLRATIQPPSAPVQQPHCSKYLQSGSDSRGSRQKHPISGRKKLESLKMVDGSMSRSRSGSNSSKQSTTSGKRELESLDSMNFKSDANITASGTGRKKWIKTPRKEKMSLRSKSTRRLLPIKSCSDCFSEASDSSSVKRWSTVLQSAEVNGLLKEDASSNSSSSKRKDKAGDLLLSKTLGVFDAKKLVKESHKKPHKRKDASKLKSEVKLDSVSMETIVELQKELASLKLTINSIKKTNSLMSRDSLASTDDSSNGRRASSPRGACSETCSLITAFLPILFSHHCYSKKRQKFEEYNKRQLLSSHVKSNASMKISESNLLVDGLDGKTKAVYVIQSLPTDQTACDATRQQKDKSASPKLLSYRSVEQMPNEKPKSKPTVEKSTQTEFSVPVTNCEASNKLRSVGTQCNKEHEIKLMENTCGRIGSRPTIWQFGPDNAMGVTFKSTCNVMEIPCSSFQRLQKNKQESKEKPKSKERKLISPAELGTAHGVVEKLMSGNVSDRDETRQETAGKLEEKLTKLNGNSCQTFSQNISIELPEDTRKPLSRRTQDSVIESIDEVDEQEEKCLSMGPSKKKSKLMTHSPPESAVESKEENATRQKNYQIFSGPSCNAGKKFCHRRRLLKSVTKPTFKFTKSE